MSQQMIEQKKSGFRVWVVFFVILAVAASLSLFVYQHREFFTKDKNPLQRNFQFQNPYLVAKDSRNNTILVDSREKRLTKIDPKGKVLFSIDGGSREAGKFYLAIDLAVDSKDNIYLVNVVVDIVDGYPGIYEILRFTPDGKFDTKLFSYTRSKAERENRDAQILGNIQVVKDYVYFVFYKDKIGSREKGCIFYRVPVQGGKPEEVVTIPGRQNFITIAGTVPGKIYMTKLDGKIYRVEEGGDIFPYSLPGGQTIVAPWGLRVGTDGSVYVSDIDTQGFFKINLSNKLESFITPDKLKAQGYDVKSRIFRYFWLGNDNGITVVDEANASVLKFNPEGKLVDKVVGGYYSEEILLHRYMIWISAILLGIAVLILLFYVYIRIMNRRLPLVLKQFLVYVPVITGFIIWGSFMIFDGLYNQQYMTLLQNHVRMIAQIGSEQISGDALERLTKPENYLNTDYLNVQQQMINVMNNSQDEWNSLPYARIYTYKNNQCYITVDWSGYYGVLYPFTYDTAVHRDAYYKGKIGWTNYSDFDSSLFVGVAPIRDSKSKIVGVYEVIYDDYILKEVQKKFMTNLVNNVTFTIVGFLAVFLVFAVILMLSLRKLRDALKEVSGGKWDASLDIRSRDEVGDLGMGFNIMAGYIRDYINMITNLNKAYVRFVPSEFLKFLERKTITDIQLGDQIKMEMSVLFSDIRSFTSISEKMTPKQNFDFINDYLSRMGPIIRDHKGFIDKYIGDAIMALFAENPENAVLTGIDMRRKLIEYNEFREKNGEMPIAIGVGVHTGSLMLGIVGEQERMDGTVISDNVNLASRLEGLTKMYGAGMIISESTLEKIPDPKKYMLRFLDKVKVKGKTAPVSIFEVLNGESSQTVQIKLETREDYEKALELYFNARFEEAIKAFQAIYNRNHDDKACSLFIKRCESMLKAGVPENWDGVAALDEK
jgi:class 3 adenylate cyclase/HAMP domain-containing protein